MAGSDEKLTADVAVKEWRISVERHGDKVVLRAEGSREDGSGDVTMNCTMESWQARQLADAATTIARQIERGVPKG